MLNKLLPGVSFCKTNILKCCKAKTFTSKELEKVSWWLMIFFFLVALSSGKHADG